MDLKKISPDSAFLLITGHATVETAIEAVNEGAFAYHVKPLDIDALKSSVRNSLSQRRLLLENRDLLDRLQHSNMELEEKNRELEHASQAKTQILSTVSHELKTPLTSIVGYMGRLLDQSECVKEPNERHRRYVETALENAHRLEALIDDLLDISRIESGSIDLDLMPIDVVQEIEDVVRRMQCLMDQKKIDVVVDIPSDLPKARADRFRLSQIVINLLSNACKYSSMGATTTITGKGDGRYLRVDVKDNGIGISEEDMSRLFAKFFRADNSLTRETSGAGLGLFITRHLVEAQGGTIWAESEEGKGSTFSFTLPLESPLLPFTKGGILQASSISPPG